MVSNTSVWWETNISIWDPVMSGWSPDRTGWNVSMGGNVATLIGEATPLAMIVTEKMPMAMFSHGTTKSDDRP